VPCYLILSCNRPRKDAALACDLSDAGLAEENRATVLRESGHPLSTVAGTWRNHVAGICASTFAIITLEQPATSYTREISCSSGRSLGECSAGSGRKQCYPVRIRILLNPPILKSNSSTNCPTDPLNPFRTGIPQTHTFP
jgi:hypothetical protein